MNSINPMSGGSIGGIGFSRGRDVEPMRETSELDWRHILLLACSYPYLSEAERNKILANGLGSHFTGHA